MTATDAPPEQDPREQVDERRHERAGDDAGQPPRERVAAGVDLGDGAGRRSKARMSWRSSLG